VQIQGPFTISVNDNSGIQQSDLKSRLNTIKDYLAELHKGIDAENDVTSQQGMITISQIVQELLPHLEADEIPLNETIVVEIGPVQSSPFDDLLRGARLS